MTTVNKHAPHAPGPRPQTWWKRTFGARHPEYAVPALIHDEGVNYTPPPIYTRPESAVQRPVNANSRDKQGYLRPVHGGIVRDKKRTR